MKGSLENNLTEKTLKLAEYIQSASVNATDTNSFRRRLKVMFALPQAKIFLIQMMDVSFRPKDNKKVAAFVKKVIQNSKFAASQLFTKPENLLVEIFLSFGYNFPGISIPVMLSKIRKDAKNVVFLKDS
ncbi:MAG: hypothetical protein H7329_05395, partial [Opitutaceae bacterium]|nr:hypothetical protein [Cytophagales bacterium]